MPGGNEQQFLPYRKEQATAPMLTKAARGLANAEE